MQEPLARRMLPRVDRREIARSSPEAQWVWVMANAFPAGGMAASTMVVSGW